jgi:hypothetical protein
MCCVSPQVRIGLFPARRPVFEPGGAHLWFHGKLDPAAALNGKGEVHRLGLQRDAPEIVVPVIAAAAPGTALQIGAGVTAGGQQIEVQVIA